VALNCAHGLGQGAGRVCDAVSLVEIVSASLPAG
jgi:hypothetical protein